MFFEEHCSGGELTVGWAFADSEQAAEFRVDLYRLAGSKRDIKACYLMMRR